MIAVLVALSVTVTLSDNRWVVYGLREFLSVDKESNIPTTFSGGLLMFSAILVFVVGVEFPLCRRIVHDPRAV
jgi:hypothetical protein